MTIAVCAGSTRGGGFEGPSNAKLTRGGEVFSCFDFKTGPVRRVGSERSAGFPPRRLRLVLPGPAAAWHYRQSRSSKAFCSFRRMLPRQSPGP